MKAMLSLVAVVGVLFVTGCAHKDMRDDKSSCGDKKEGSCDMKEHESKKGGCCDKKEGSCDMKGHESKGCCDMKEGSCDMKAVPHELKVELNQKVGASTASLVNGHILLGASPKDMKDYQSAKEMDVKLIVDLREEKEFNKATVQKAVTDLGMTYVHIPMSKKGAIQKDAVEKIELAVHGEGKPEKSWVTCATGNRAAAWLAIQAVKHHKFSNDEAIKLAESAGLKPDMKAKVQKYLKALNK